MAAQLAVVHLWKEWGLHVLVLLSFTLQVALFVLAELRRRLDSGVLRAFVWSAYMLADSVAIYAIGHLSVTSQAAEHQVMALWAPLLLVHLGGQDNITAYALEDNRLWLRHLQTLAVQATGAAYVLYVSLLQEPVIAVGGRRHHYWLRCTAALLFVVGIVKYGERIVALISANGYPSGVSYEIAERNSVTCCGSAEVSEWDTEGLWQVAHGMLIVAQDLLQSPLLVVFVEMDYKEQMRGGVMCKVAEMQLSLMHDVLYSKAEVICSPFGQFTRAFSWVATAVAFFLFHLHQQAGAQHQHGSRKDVVVTYVLLAGAVTLETVSGLRGMVSTWTWRFLVYRYGPICGRCLRVARDANASQVDAALARREELLWELDKVRIRQDTIFRELVLTEHAMGINAAGHNPVPTNPSSLDYWRYRPSPLSVPPLEELPLHPPRSSTERSPCGCRGPAPVREPPLYPYVEWSPPRSASDTEKQQDSRSPGVSTHPFDGHVELCPSPKMQTPADEASLPAAANATARHTVLPVSSSCSRGKEAAAGAAATAAAAAPHAARGGRPSRSSRPDGGDAPPRRPSGRGPPARRGLRPGGDQAASACQDGAAGPPTPSFRAATSTLATMATAASPDLLAALRRRCFRCRPAPGNWSGSMGQLNLFHMCSSAAASRINKTAQAMGVEDWWNTLLYSPREPARVSPRIKELLVRQVERSVGIPKDSPDHIRNSRGRAALLECWGAQEVLLLESVVGLDFEDSILAWHVATNGYLFWYRSLRNQQQEEEDDLAGAVQALTNYMVFLLAARTYMLPPTTSRASYARLCFKLIEDCQGSSMGADELACRVALQMPDQELQQPPQAGHQDLLTKGTNLCRRLIEKQQLMQDAPGVAAAGNGNGTTTTLHLIAQVWSEMLCYAGAHCSARSHAARLSDGSELVTLAALLVRYCERNHIISPRSWERIDIHCDPSTNDDVAASV
ncbi:unnamed protein product [Urochloa decumbens]|uniref:DUF4220 domain-containing protein n=1 Tax=Urochloa decumbens TaxID=240449 RepID=A0ABC8VK61_9POAL